MSLGKDHPIARGGNLAESGGDFLAGVGPDEVGGCFEAALFDEGEDPGADGSDVAAVAFGPFHLLDPFGG